jgi:hypothetical protein
LDDDYNRPSDMFQTHSPHNQILKICSVLKYHTIFLTSDVSTPISRGCELFFKKMFQHQNI